jgi:DNA-binding CsgD family transcriptional regulator
VERPDFDQLEKACRRLGEAVVDPAAWPALMEEICRPLGAAGAIMLQTDARTPDVPRTEAVDEMARAYFAGGWATRDIWTGRGVSRFLHGKKAFVDAELLTRDELEAAPLVNEVFLPNGFKWAAAVGFSAGSGMWGLCLHRTVRQDAFDAFDSSVLETLSDRLTEVATLSAAVGRIALSSVTNALNAVRQPAIALDRTGLVLDANCGAEALFDADLHVRERRPIVGDPAARRDLENLIDRLPTASDLATLPCDPIIVRRREQRPVILRVLPVHGAARTPFLGARVILTLTPVRPRSAPEAAALAGAFGLTAAEARLASIIAEGLNPEQAATALGLSPATTRNQLKGIFDKTDTHRQSELVALLSRL